MIARPMLLAAVVAAACRGDARAPGPEAPQNKPRTAMPTDSAADVHLSENEPAQVSNRKVVVFNIWERSYARADGARATGPSAVLSVSDGTKPVETEVGAGSRVTIGSDAYDVISVAGDDVVLRRAAP